MTFGERIRELRTQKGLTQPQLADSIGVSVRTVKSYELGTSLPKTRETYQKLAEFFDVNINYLLAKDEQFILDAGATYPSTATTEIYTLSLHDALPIYAGATYGSRGKHKQQAHALIAEVSGLFAGGGIAEEDMDEMMKAIQDAYWIAKERNKKYTPKEYSDKKKE